jgi:hypothetical protein
MKKVFLLVMGFMLLTLGGALALSDSDIDWAHTVVISKNMPAPGPAGRQIMVQVANVALNTEPEMNLSIQVFIPADKLTDKAFVKAAILAKLNVSAALTPVPTPVPTPAPAPVTVGS